MFGWTIRPRLYGNGISAAYLSDMAAKGWYFRRLGFNVVLFKKGVPGNLRYAVDVMDQEHRKIDEKPDSPHIREYLRLCEESGWQFLDNAGALYVFAAKHEKAVPMQTDPAAYEKAVFSFRKGKLLQLLLSFVLLLVVVGNVLWNPHRYLTRKWGLSLWLESVLILGDILLRAGYVAWTLTREHKELSLGKIPEEAYGRRMVWLIFILEAGMVLLMATALCQIRGLRIWLGVPGFLLPFLLLPLLQEGLQKLGWNTLHFSKEGADWLGRLPILLFSLGMGLMPFFPGPGRGLADSPNQPPAGWRPVVEAEDFGWEGEVTILHYESSVCAQSCEMWEGEGKEQLRSILYTSKIGALLDSFYKRGPIYDDWWNQRQEVWERTQLAAERLGIEEGMAWRTGSERWHYLLRAENQVLYLMTAQALSEEQLAMAAKKMCESAP